MAVVCPVIASRLLIYVAEPGMFTVQLAICVLVHYYIVTC